MAREAKTVIKGAGEGEKKKKEGVFVPMSQRLPYDPANLHRSKAEFLEAQRLRKERELKHKELDAQMDKGIATPVEEQAAEPQKTEVQQPQKQAKPRGRPKVIK